MGWFPGPPVDRPNCKTVTPSQPGLPRRDARSTAPPGVPDVPTGGSRSITRTRKRRAHAASGALEADMHASALAAASSCRDPGMRLPSSVGLADAPIWQQLADRARPRGRLLAPDAKAL